MADAELGAAEMDAERPAFRPAQVVSEAEADAAIGSGDAERMSLALIDGSRCLPDAWAMQYALELTHHADARVRWAAVFALDQARAAWVPGLRNDFELIFHLQRLAAEDSDSSIRAIAAAVFAHVISMLLRSD
ncbi:MAG TPA: hypothetical protein VF102_02520 [Gemmatimonadaceae bacterium]